jgi:hypothetical protein
MGAVAWGLAPALRFPSLSGARDEFHLAAIVQNLKTLARLLKGKAFANRPEIRGAPLFR